MNTGKNKSNTVDFLKQYLISFPVIKVLIVVELPKHWRGIFDLIGPFVQKQT